MPDPETIDATDITLKGGAGGLGFGGRESFPAPGTDVPGPGDSISGIVGKSSGLTGPGGTLTERARQRGSALDSADRTMEGRLERDRAERERAYRQEAAGPDSLPPKWDADAERAKRIRGPIEQFGSVGVIFALAASAFTKQPMTSALNGAAAAMGAIKAGDEENYKSAYAAWKDNTELALKRFQMERELFEDANKLATTDLNEWRTKQASIAARFDNQKVVAMLDSGMDKEVVDIQNAQIKGAVEMKKAADEFELFDLRHDLLKIEGDEFKKAHPDATQADIIMHKLQVKEDMMTGRQDIQQEVLKDARQQYWEKNGKPMPYAEQAKLVQQMKASGGAANIAMMRFLEEHPNASATEIQSFLSQGHNARSAPAIALQKFMQEHPEATSSDIEQFAAGYAADVKAQRDFATGPQGQRVNSINVAIDHLDTLKGLSDALKNKNMPLFNQLSQRWAQENGKPAPTNFDAAKQIIGQEVVKAIVSGGGGVTERNQAQDTLNRSKSPEQISGAIETIERLMAGQLRGLKLQYEQTTKRQDFDQRISGRAKDVLSNIGGGASSDGWKIEKVE